jgi:hypothetical protein
MGDGDCDGDLLSSGEEIERLLKAAGAETVMVEAEVDPEEDEGFVRLEGVTGIVVDLW